MRSYPVKKSNFGSAVSEILCHTQKDRQTYKLYYKDCLIASELPQVYSNLFEKGWVAHQTVYVFLLVSAL